MVIMKQKVPVDFKVYPSNVYGDKFKNVIVKSKVDIEDANNLGHDAVAAYINAQATLPVTAVKDVTAETFLIIKFTDGEEVIIGESWIIENSVNYHNSTEVVLTVPNAGWGDLDDISAALAARGYSVSKADVK